MSPNPLRNIPSVRELLENPALRAVVDRIHPGAVMATIRSVLDEVAAEVHNAAVDKTMPSATDLARRISRRVFETAAPGVKPAINASGVLLNPRLGPPPLCDEAIKAMVVVAGDYSLRTDEGVAWAEPVEHLLATLTGAETAMVVHSEAAATMLALAALAAGKQTVIARGQIISRNACYHLPNLAAASGTSLREVGAVNQVHLDDYARMIDQKTAVLLRVQRREDATGADEVSIEQLAALARERGLAAVDDLGSAALLDLAPFGLGSVPVVSHSVASGADLVLFGHEMLGSPACGVIVGRRRWVDLVRRWPTAGMFRPNLPTLAALAATLQLAQNPQQARHRIPLLQLATTGADNLRNRARRLATQLAATAAVEEATAVEASGHLSGDDPTGILPGWAVRITPAGRSVEQLAEALWAAEPAVIAQVEPDALLLNLRTVLPRQDVALLDAMESIASA